jgi:hypothetical protein
MALLNHPAQTIEWLDDVEATRESQMIANLEFGMDGITLGTMVRYMNILLPPTLFRRFWVLRNRRIDGGMQTDPINRDRRYELPMVMLSGIEFGEFFP